MNLAGLILRAAGWHVNITVPPSPRSVICVAPHTSNWDFVLGKLAYASVGRKAGFLMKESWFFFPLGYFFRAMGGIPVPRKGKNGSLVNLLVEKFKASKTLSIAITPEGTRKLTKDWHTGFLQVARQAGVPILLGAIDFPSKTISIEHTFIPTGDTDNDMREIKKYYSRFSGKYPDQFSAY